MSGVTRPARFTLELPFEVECPGCGQKISGVVLLGVNHYAQSGGGPVTAVSARGAAKGSRIVAFHECPDEDAPPPPAATAGRG